VTITIRDSESKDALAISQLALRAKGHWGYDAAFLETCRSELTWTEADCNDGGIFIAEDTQGRLVGFFQVSGSGSAGELEALFVDPPSIGIGLGRKLLLEALQEARRNGWKRVCLDADPFAVSFYQKFGAKIIGATPSGSIPGRTLPRMCFEIQNVI
jgi:GNAT superfamily N-acetyltransferase